MDAVPYIMYTSTNEVNSGAPCYDEQFGVKDSSALGLKNYDRGEKIMDDFLGK